jgi:hypothetical protein
MAWLYQDELHVDFGRLGQDAKVAMAGGRSVLNI